MECPLVCLGPNSIWCLKIRSQEAIFITCMPSLLSAASVVPSNAYADFLLYVQRTYLYQTTLPTSLRNPQAQEVLKVIESLRIWKKKVRLCEKITSLPLVMKRSFIQKIIILAQMHSILWWILIPSRNVYIYIPSIGKKKLNIIRTIMQKIEGRKRIKNCISNSAFHQCKPWTIFQTKLSLLFSGLD